MAQTAVHQCHLKLVFEIGESAQSAKHRMRPELFDRIDEQPVKHHDLHMGNVFAAAFDQFLALLHGEHRGFLGIDGDCDDHLIEQQTGPDHQIEVPVGERIERAGIEYGFHRNFLS